MKKAVIFDLDGTLTNTLKSLWKSTNMALATAGLPPHEIDSYKYFAVLVTDTRLSVIAFNNLFAVDLLIMYILLTSVFFCYANIVYLLPIYTFSVIYLYF